MLAHNVSEAMKMERLPEEYLQDLVRSLLPGTTMITRKPTNHAATLYSGKNGAVIREWQSNKEAYRGLAQLSPKELEAMCEMSEKAGEGLGLETYEDVAKRKVKDLVEAINYNLREIAEWTYTKPVTLDQVAVKRIPFELGEMTLVVR